MSASGPFSMMIIFGIDSNGGDCQRIWSVINCILSKKRAFLYFLSEFILNCSLVMNILVQAESRLSSVFGVINSSYYCMYNCYRVSHPTPSKCERRSCSWFLSLALCFNYSLYFFSNQLLSVVYILVEKSRQLESLFTHFTFSCTRMTQNGISCLFISIERLDTNDEKLIFDFMR